MKLHMVFDALTGEAKARGRSGRWYTREEIKQAYDPNDPQGVVFKADLDRTDWTDANAQQMLANEIHDCPQCRMARALGLQPSVATGYDLGAMAGKQHKPRARRWRQQKRRG